VTVTALRPAFAEPAEAAEPPEIRGVSRDDVRLLVAHRHSGRIEHARFAELPELLDPGDLLVINTSATLPAALAVRGPDPELRLHLSTPDREGAGWLVELRRADERFAGGRPGQVLLLPAGGTAVLLERHGGRLWRAALRLPAPVPQYLARHGEPIRYRHTERTWPLARYQTVYATEPGSAEMPSAGRAFTPELVTGLVAAGIDVAPVVLHAGVSSLEAGERPHAERYRVPRFTAERIKLVRGLGGRVFAVGTTVVRALESAAAEAARAGTDPLTDGAGLSDLGGQAHEGWTDLVVEPGTPIRALDGLLSGFHDRDSSHLAMLEAIAGRDLLERSYAEAADAGYLRHEFGDLHLILP
jgi:S-adenosylmethionine:tRNA ribosyltransferase-isomerase